MIKPYFETKLGKLYHRDCSEIMLGIETESIDCIVTSPPYNKAISRSYHKSDSWQTKTGLKIEYGDFKDNLNENIYQQNQIVFINECLRTLKKTGSFFYNHKNRTINKGIITPYSWILKTNAIVKQEIIWHSKSFVEIDKVKFLPGTERIYWIIKERIQPKFDGNFAKYTDVWNISSAKGKNRYNHPAPFPEKLSSRCISAVTKEHDVICDPFLGSGTTAIVCERLNRRWIGIEISKEYCDIAIERIKKETAQYKLEMV